MEEKEAREKLEQARGELRKELKLWVEATGSLLEPLKTLNEDQVVAAVSLSLMFQSVAQATLSSTELRKEIAARFKDELTTVSAGLSRLADDKALRISRAISDAELDCVSALKKCEDEGRKESECWESWGPCARAIYEVMKELEGMRGWIGDLLGGLRPPRPIPWPVDPKEPLSETAVRE